MWAAVKYQRDLGKGHHMHSFHRSHLCCNVEDEEVKQTPSSALLAVPGCHRGGFGWDTPAVPAAVGMPMDNPVRVQRWGKAKHMAKH